VCWGVRVSNVWLSASTSQKVSTSLKSSTFLKTTPIGYADPPSAVHVRYIRPNMGVHVRYAETPPHQNRHKPRRLRRLRPQVVHVGYVGYAAPPWVSTSVTPTPKLSTLVTSVTPTPKVEFRQECRLQKLSFRDTRTDRPTRPSSDVRYITYIGQ
jgi:hypothetical protein